MEEARAMLDALMGPSRNQDQATKDTETPDFADEKVCKNFLVGFCPHDWFTTSRRKMPPCNKIHSEVLRDTFEAHPEVAKYRRAFEEQFLKYLAKVTRECDMFIGREKIKCRPKGSGGVTTRMPPDVQEKYDALQKEHQKLVKGAEETADESLSRSEELTRQALEVEQELNDYQKRYRFEFPGEEVCEVCGVRYASQAADNPDWHERASHLNGKMHHGWLQIRQKLQELKEKERLWEREDYREEQKANGKAKKPKRGKTTSSDRQRSKAKRSRSRRNARHKNRNSRDPSEKKKKARRLQLHSQAEERETALTARQEMLQREHQKVWEDLQQYRQKHNDKERNLRAFVRLAQDAFSMVTELQESFVEQTRRYQELSQRVRAQQQEMQQDILEAEQVAALSLQCAGELKSVLGHARDMSSAGEEQWKQDAHRLQEQLHNLHANHREAARTVREFRQADDARKQEEDRRREEQAKQAEERKKTMMERHGLVTSPNIIRQMAQAMVGIEVDKIDQKNRREKRKLRVICDVKTVRGIAVNQVKLQWSKAPYREWSEKCSCDLSQVMSLGYAFAARATWLFPDQVSPHHCFSLQTPARSFDFICFSDNDVEALVLVISRLCTRIRGWPLHGGVSSHAKFTAMKGWSKVQAACRSNRNQPLSTYLREAAEKMPARPSQLPRVPSPDETDEEEEEEEEIDEDCVVPLALFLCSLVSLLYCPNEVTESRSLVVRG
ncbi:Luc7l3 [Symbiodinium necroappetens]|uniref:Luc7l3 protein n=1 Tax=Symbiodinium necroappetens TaxID=1628268 RepID=A0A812KWU3_9DINO|nr:Luc7l3 [Symbiodinium necroappetens]